jgi:hypothetical protein
VVVVVVDVEVVEVEVAKIISIKRGTKMVFTYIRMLI